MRGYQHTTVGIQRLIVRLTRPNRPALGSQGLGHAARDELTVEAALAKNIFEKTFLREKRPVRVTHPTIYEMGP
jgi:hypothetical protein